MAKKKTGIFLLDEKLRSRNLSIWNYVFQSLLATVTVLIVIHFLSITAEAVVVAVIGSTTFVVFTIPDQQTAQPRNVIGGHTVCVLVGCLFAFSMNYIEMGMAIGVSGAIGLSIFLMLITDTEHPPAAGSSIPIILGGIVPGLVIFIVGSAVLLSLARIVLKPWLKDLM